MSPIDFLKDHPECDYSRHNTKKMVYGSFKYDNRRDNRDDEEALGTIEKGCDDGNDAGGADEEEEEANDIIIATADSTWFTLAYLPFLLLMVVLSCFMLGIYFSIGTTTFSSWLLSSSSSSSLLSSSLSLGLSSSYNSNNNNNNIDESVILSTQDLDGVAIATHNNIDTNIVNVKQPENILLLLNIQMVTQLVMNRLIGV
eukprot:CAMPEP_0170858488 /NCGR_PEP_ID=MMETSP0734-20130129/16042_1 /TAXON_ID=186038 /ORGANISM="Fragilariopsis kerguelensis, Strain L26-C5" /LENGTH=199 /DNA_ID=CAMNT_0011231175 /DNA_START=68 /DNA_END=668 /DNA_ORIENTATION=+